MTASREELKKKFDVKELPLSSQYDMDWVVKHEMGPNVLWLTESLCQVLLLRAGKRVLDLGCGSALSSIFLAKEFGVQVWAVDLWIKPTENLQRIRSLGLEDKVFPIKAEAHDLPFAEGYFDAIVSMDAYHYFGTDVFYLDNMVKLLRDDGRIGIVSPAAERDPRPKHLGDYWYWINSVQWWRNHWERNPKVQVQRAEFLPNGWELWVQWEEFLMLYGKRKDPDISFLLNNDKDNRLGFVRMVAAKKMGG